jgi:hypothetical protein
MSSSPSNRNDPLWQNVIVNPIQGVSLELQAFGRKSSTELERGVCKDDDESEDDPDETRSAGCVNGGSSLSASAQSLYPANMARRVCEWCRVEGARTGVTVIVILCALIINLLVILVLHCTSIMDTLIGRPGIRTMGLVSPAVVGAVGIMCGALLVSVVWTLVTVVSITCRHSATHAAVGRRLREQSKSQWRVCRAWDLFELATGPGGRFFDVFEFGTEVMETCLQILAVREYADNGVDRMFLDIYVAIIGLNSLSSIALVLPKCSPTRWSRMSPVDRASRERFVLILDVVCDALCEYLGILMCVCVCVCVCLALLTY